MLTARLAERRPSQRRSALCRALAAGLLGWALILLTASSLSAQSPRQITWAELQPSPQVDFAAAFGQLSQRQLQDLATLAQLRWWLADQQISPNSAEAQQAEQLAQSLSQQGLDLKVLLPQVYQVQAEANDTTAVINQPIKLTGHVLPLTRVTPGQRVSQFLLVPYVGACIHVPPPPPNQVIYLETPTPIEPPAAFTPVWITGQLRPQAATYELFRVDGSRPVQASYALTLTSLTKVTAKGREGRSLMPVALPEHLPWWQRAQIQSAAALSQSLDSLQLGSSPTGLWLGLLLAFGYGVVHTLGPGHGKAVILAYFVGEGGSLWRGLSMGVGIAVGHVLSATLLVLLSDEVVRQASGTTPASYRLVRLVSYAAIALIGGSLLVQARRSVAPIELSPRLSDLTRGQPPAWQPRHWLGGCGCGCPRPGRSALALAVGAVPCSGALLVLLYGLANDRLGGAVLLVAAISLGMAITLSALGVIALLGRGFVGRRWPISRRTLQRLRIAGAGVILLVGVVLFMLTLLAPPLTEAG